MSTTSTRTTSGGQVAPGGTDRAVSTSSSSGTGRLRGGAGFAVALTAVVAMMIGASAPSPFYPVLQQEIGFSAGMMTTIFGVYALALLATLLVTGSLSDHIGRRPVLAVGFVVLAASMAGFWHADSVTTLLLSRVVQGVAGGLLLSTMTAAVTDLEPRSRPGLAATLNSVTPLFGLAAGALAAGAVLDASPTGALTIVFAALTAAYVVLSLAVLALPETSPRHDGWARSLRPRVGIPAPARPAFRRSAPALFAGWATGGLYLSLGAPIVGQAPRGHLPRRPGLGRRRPHRDGLAQALPVAQPHPASDHDLRHDDARARHRPHARRPARGVARRLPARRGGRRLWLRHVVPRHHALDHPDGRPGAAR